MMKSCVALNTVSYIEGNQTGQQQPLLSAASKLIHTAS